MDGRTGMRTQTIAPGLVAFLAALILAGSAGAQTLSGNGLIGALRQGGYVLVMRHARSPAERPTGAAVNPDNPNGERQLDAIGRETAQAMGAALKSLHVPVGDVLSSPTYRALETVKYAGLGSPQPIVQLGDGGQGMLADTEGARSAWLREKVKEMPRAGTDLLMVTHAPNINGAFGESAMGISDGETMVFRPDGKGGSELVARVKIEDWPSLAAGN